MLENYKSYEAEMYGGFYILNKKATYDVVFLMSGYEIEKSSIITA